jgi:hypothetical protein
VLAVITLVSVWLSAETFREELAEAPSPASSGDTALSEPSSRSPSPVPPR